LDELKSSAVFRRVGQHELLLCLTVNGLCHRRGIRQVLALASRLGDGVFWYALMLVMPLMDGWRGVVASLHMGLVALVGVALYKCLKRKLVRHRPFAVHHDIRLGAAPLDEHSFPSGHTLHAVGFTIIATSYYPYLALLLIPFAIAVALSRVVLGLHYPTDVLAGAAIGASLASLSLGL
jgi:undecaprenyl-diphosphatase